jgi:hypothetical protein
MQSSVILTFITHPLKTAFNQVLILPLQVYVYTFTEGGKIGEMPNYGVLIAQPEP